MAKTLSKEIKAIVSHNFYPQNYMESALEADAHALKADGITLSTLRPVFQKLLGEVDENSRLLGPVADSARSDLIEALYKALGYYDVSQLSDRETVQIQCLQKQWALRIERAFILKNARESELWLLRHFPGAISNDNDAFPQQRSPAVSASNEEVQRIAWAELIDAVFDSDFYNVDYLLVNSGDFLYVLEKGKWQDEGEAYLEIDLTELFALNDPSLYRLSEVLTSTKAFPLASAESYHAALEQSAHKKAAEVTKALRETVRESIEILANEVLASHRRQALGYWKARNLEKSLDRKECAKELQDQTIRYIYRMLFFLFAESQSKNALPVQSECYLRGYSMEHLRDLEGKSIAVASRRQGESNFIQQTLHRLANIYFNGYQNERIWEKDEHTSTTVQRTDAIGFSFPSLGSDLFDTSQTPLFTEAVLPDVAMQRVIEKLSLARVGTGKKTRTHRVHYAGLGINQLGAVYEGLLSLNPDILDEKVALLVQDPKDHAPRVIPYSKRSELDGDKLQKKDNGDVVTRDKGTFVLTPVGLERKFSASFYTAEVLTRFVAKEAVAALLKDDASLKRMEDLKILEPAMGSGAFLNAVIDELSPRMAEEYRKKDLTEDGNTKRSFEYYRSKAKDFLMRNCVYGVDLNPTAVELAKISLWLNCLHEDGNLPFLDFRMRCGNSLVGAWLRRHRQKDDLPHFLFPHPNSMNSHLEGLVLGDKKRPFIEDQSLLERLRSLKREYETFGTDEKTKKKLSLLGERVNQLYTAHKKAREQYQQKIATLLDPKEKHKCFLEFVEENVAYNQLRAIMDLWCALWFWPHAEVKNLPRGEEFLTALEWCAETPLAYGPKQVDQIIESGISFLLTAREVSMMARFFHWDLEFPEVLDGGGFDLCIGNPPWASVQWDDADFFEERSPGSSSMEGDAKNKVSGFSKLLQANRGWIADYKEFFTRIVGYSDFLKSSSTYPLDDRSRTNTYKYFYQRCCQLTRSGGINSMIAQDGIVRDDKCAALRPTFYKELMKAFRFVNEMLFEDIGNLNFFMVWVCKKGKSEINFELIDNLFLPITVDLCRSESANAPQRGYKDENGKFELRGHPDRIVHIDEPKLRTIAKYFSDSSLEAVTLPTIHSESELAILSKLASHPGRFDSVTWEFSQGFNEYNAPIEGFIVKNPGQRKRIERAVLTGPNTFVANPAYQVPKIPFKNHRSFSRIDLTTISESYFPSTVYELTEKGLTSSEKLRKTGWNGEFTQLFRLIYTEWVGTTGERTLQAAILPPGPMHINTCASLAFKDQKDLLKTAGIFSSLVFDFFMRSVSKKHITEAILKVTPFLTEEQSQNPLIPALLVRTLRLNCVSNHYAALWKDHFDQSFLKWDVDSPYVPTTKYRALTSEWQKDSPIREEMQREQALCEIDAIVSIIFGIEKQTLIGLYRSQFSVLQQNWQDLPDQVPDKAKAWFPRAKAMADAYDQLSAQLSTEKKAA